MSFLEYRANIFDLSSYFDGFVIVLNQSWGIQLRTGKTRWYSVARLGFQSGSFKWVWYWFSIESPKQELILFSKIISSIFTGFLKEITPWLAFGGVCINWRNPSLYALCVFLIPWLTSLSRLGVWHDTSVSKSLGKVTFLGVRLRFSSDLYSVRNNLMTKWWSLLLCNSLNFIAWFVVSFEKYIV